MPIAETRYRRHLEFMFDSIRSRTSSRWSVISLTCAGIISAVGLSATAVSAEPACQYKTAVCGMLKAQAEASPAIPRPKAPKRTEPACSLKTSACLRMAAESKAIPPRPEHKAKKEMPCTMKTAVCLRMEQEKAASQK